MKLTVLYGTQTGVAEEVAESIAFAAIQANIQVHVSPADAVPLTDWPQLSPVLFICSTSGQGDAPESIKQSWNNLRMPDAPSMSDLKYAVFGLGDSSYSKYNYMGKMLHNRLGQLGGVALVHRGLGDDQDAGGFLEQLNPWLRLLWTALGIENFPGDGLGGCKVTPKFSVTTDETVSEGVNPMVPRNIPTTMLRVAFNERLTAQDHFQAVHHVGFQRLSSTQFHCGDVLSVYPRSSMALANELIRRCRFDGDEQVTVRLSYNETGLSVTTNAGFLGRSLPLRYLLVHYFDLEATTSRSFLAMLRTTTENEEEIERLTELAADNKLDEYHSYCYREKRNVVEVLSEFPSCFPSLNLVLSFLKPMRPRRYSISSGPTADSDVVTITVARFEFTTPYRRNRRGVCSTMLCGAAPGDEIECCVEPSTLVPFDLESGHCQVPMILIGPGTGIAPLRGIIREAVVCNWTAPIHLFCGFRNEAKDFLHGSEWAQLVRDGNIILHTSFSRDGKDKKYVQHALVEPKTAKEIASLMADNAFILVCGNSKQMPKDVERALTSIAETYICSGDSNKATALMKTLRSEGLFVMDTWSS